MMDMLREAPLGQMIRWITKNRVLKYPEETEGFELPESYIQALNHYNHLTPPTQTSNASNPLVVTPETREEDKRNDPVDDNHSGSDKEAQKGSDTGPPGRKEASDPGGEKNDTILVDWYSEDDPANPQNWSMGKKIAITTIIYLYTFVVYTGSSIYVSSETAVINIFGVGPVVASLGLALYVLAYGCGPLLFAPLTEIPIIGRSPVYIVTFFIFTMLSLGAALVKNFPGLLVLRFFQGFFGSPCLANGAASLQDIFNPLQIPFAIVGWVAAAYCGPALGPLLSGFAVTAENWHWSLWEIFWAACPILILMFLLPETIAPTILLQRAKRLRKLTGSKRLVAQSEIDPKYTKPLAILLDAIIKPLEITIKDPAVAFVNLYSALIYGIYYSFFEVFPLVYPVYYGTSIGVTGVVFVCIFVACAIGVIIHCLYLRYSLIPGILKNGPPVQEHTLVPALFCVFGPPAGLFIFAWTARPDIIWLAPTIGIVVYAGLSFVVFQCIFTYIPMSYPQYAASLFAANDFFRSALACGSILFSRPLFVNMGIDRGVSLLGGLSVLGIIGMFVLWIHGAKLRARSSFAVKT